MSILRTVLVGDVGFERATVWSVVGFALAYVAFDVAALFVVLDAATLFAVPPAEWIALAVAVLVVLATIGFASGGGGVLPCLLLTYGPFAGVLLRLVEFIPLFAAIPPIDSTPLAWPAEPLLVAVPSALAVALGGYVVGRAIDAIRSSVGSSGDAGSKDAESENTESGDDGGTSRGSATDT